MKSKKSLIIMVLVVVISLVGVSYAFFDYYKIGGNQKVTAGKLNLVFNEGTDTINLSNVFPETKEEARARTKNQITFTITGVNTTENKDVWYQIMLNNGDPEEGMTRFKPDELVFDLIEVDENGNDIFVVDAMSFADFNKKIIWVNKITQGTSSNVNRTYKLRMWLSENVVISDTLANPDYTTSEFANGYASIKVSVYGDFEPKKLPLNFPATISEVALHSMPLTEADAEGTMFVRGGVEATNFVTYSNILWRVLSVDSDSVKLITYDSRTSSTWNSSSSANVDYKTSGIPEYLTNAFLPTLVNKENLLVSTDWDCTTDETPDTTKPTTTCSVSSQAGLITLYEYIMTIDNGYSYLNMNIGSHKWTMTPASTTYIWSYMATNDLGVTSYSSVDPRASFNIQPVINVKATALISSGKGTETSPYVLVTD